ncbi:MAG: tyrosine-type recombinase/integrase [Nitrospinales bacterium]
MKFTDAKIKSLKPSEKTHIVWEGSGFGVRVSPTGAKSFILMYRVPGNRTRRLWTIGKYPQITLATARRMAAQGREKIIKGIDPGAKAVTQKKADREAYTVKDLAEEYLEKWARPRKRSAREDERILYKDVVPAWGERKAKDITRRDVILLLDKIVERGAPIAANRTLGIIRRMFGFAVSRGVLPTSPCVEIEPPGKENQRDRVLTGDEVKVFWEGLADCRMDQKTRLALKLLLILGQRKGEVTSAEWNEFDLEKNWWTIPKEKTKNSLPHRVFLSSMALEVLGELRELSDSRWLFPSPRGDKPITTRSISHALKNNREIFGIPQFTPHDLRRSMASFMASAGVPRLTISKILNHVESGITAVYDRYGYDREKRQALETWGRKLKSILTGEKGNVIPLQAK